MRYVLAFILLVVLAALAIDCAVFSAQAIAVAGLGERAQFLGHWSVGLFAYCAVLLAGLWAGWSAFSRLFWLRITRNQESIRKAE